MSEQVEAVSLIEAVAGFLAEIEPELTGRRAFHAKVAQNALAIVARELIEKPAEKERELLAALLAQPGSLDDLRASLCTRLRSGALDAASPGLVDSLLAVARAKCAVDNPRYATFKRLSASTMF